MCKEGWHARVMTKVVEEVDWACKWWFIVFYNPEIRSIWAQKEVGKILNKKQSEKEEK